MRGILLQLREGLDRAATRWNPREAAWDVQRRNDVAVLAPASTVSPMSGWVVGRVARQRTTPSSNEMVIAIPATVHGKTGIRASGATMPGLPASPPSCSSTALRASPISRNRCLTFFSRQRRTSGRMPAGTAPHSGSVFNTAARVSETVSPANGPLARQHLVQHHAVRPDVGALIHHRASRLLG